jgi:hypothetical protein
MLLYKDTWGALQLLLTLSLMGEVIYLLRPLRSVAPTSNPIEPPTHHSLFGAGSQGPPSHNMSVGSTPFSLFSAFGNNAFLSASFPTGGNPSYRQPIPMQGIIPAYRGQTQELLSHQDLGILGRDQFPRQECRSGEILFTTNGTPDKVLCLCPWDQHGATLPKVLECNARPTIYVLILRGG